MDKFTFREVMEVVVFLVIYFSIDSLIMKYVKQRMSWGARRFIYLIGLVCAFLVFTTLSSLFNYDIQIICGR